MRGRDRKLLWGHSKAVNSNQKEETKEEKESKTEIENQPKSKEEKKLIEIIIEGILESEIIKGEISLNWIVILHHIFTSLPVSSLISLFEDEICHSIFQ